MEIIRFNVFETNSSSTHTITVCMKNKYDAWKNGELYLFGDEFITKEERDRIIKSEIVEEKMEIDWDNKIIKFKDIEIPYIDYDDRQKKIKNLITTEDLKEITEEEVTDFLERNGYDMPVSYDDYFNNSMLETYETNFVSESGDKIVAFGNYGNDY